MASVMAAMFIIAIEATIVSTAMPQIAGQLGDLHLYAWVFSSFLLTQTATTVVFGKLADLYGRKPILLIGIGIFLIGTVLCGFSRSMPMLIMFRLIQGVGAGAIQPVALTVVGDLYPAQERGKIQGYLASVWGVSSVLGPLAGALIIQHLYWGWIFWINIPIGLAAATGFTLFLRENVSSERRSVDTPGAALFAITIAALMVAITELGTADHRTAAAALCAFAVTAGLFVWQERRARDPMLAFALWSFRPIATANAATVLSSMALVGLTAFLPLYVQGVLNQSALVAGFAMTMMVLGWPIGATVAAKQFPRFGLRNTLLFGAALMPTGAIAFVALGPATSPVVAGVGSLVMGLGMGFLNTAAIVIVQGSVGWSERGAATASSVFSRNLGSTLGATVLGGVLNIGLAHRGGQGVDYNSIRALLDHPGSAISDDTVRVALGQSLHLAFWTVFAIALLTLLVSTLVPSVKLNRAPHEVAT
jgi:EmrB/QacA subfamily drug resistance transporter